jgi:hypothetical protein
MTTADNNDHPFSHHCLLHRGRLISHAFTLLQHIETKNVLRCRSNIALLRFLFRRRRPFSSEFFFRPFPHAHVGNCWFPATKERCFLSLISLECFPTNGSLRFPVEHVAQAREGAKMAFQQDALLVPRWTGGSRATHIILCFEHNFSHSLCIHSLFLSLSLVFCGNAVISSTLLYFRYR